MATQKGAPPGDDASSTDDTSSTCSACSTTDGTVSKTSTTTTEAKTKVALGVNSTNTRIVRIDRDDDAFFVMNPLYKRIQVPIPFPLTSYADEVIPDSSGGTDSTDSTDDFDCVDTATTHLQTYMAIEEATTSALVHAACRLHEALLITMQAFERLIFVWTGLTPPEAAAAALVYDLLTVRDDGDDGGGDITPERQLHKGMMLQIVLQITQLLAAAAGKMASMTIQVRGQAEAKGLLLPLSALSSVSSASSASSVNSVRKTFSAFIQQDSAAATLTAEEVDEALRRSPSDVLSPLEKALERHSGCSYYDLPHGLDHEDCFNIMRILRETRYRALAVRNDMGAETGASALVATSGEAAAVRQKVQDTVNVGLSAAIEHTAMATLHAVELAFVILKRRLPWSAWFKQVLYSALSSALSSLASLGRRAVWSSNNGTGHDIDDDDVDEETRLLQQALRACKQAVATAKTARLPVLPARKK